MVWENIGVLCFESDIGLLSYESERDIWKKKLIEPSKGKKDKLVTILNIGVGFLRWETTLC